MLGACCAPRLCEYLAHQRCWFFAKILSPFHPAPVAEEWSQAIRRSSRGNSVRRLRSLTRVRGPRRRLASQRCVSSRVGTTSFVTISPPSTPKHRQIPRLPRAYLLMPRPTCSMGGSSRLRRTLTGRRSLRTESAAAHPTRGTRPSFHTSSASGAAICYYSSFLSALRRRACRKCRGAEVTLCRHPQLAHAVGGVRASSGHAHPPEHELSDHVRQ